MEAGWVANTDRSGLMLMQMEAGQMLVWMQAGMVSAWISMQHTNFKGDFDTVIDGIRKSVKHKSCRKLSPHSKIIRIIIIGFDIKSFY